MATQKRATPSEKKVKNPFINEGLKHINKTEADVITESITNFLKEASIDCKTQISERKVSQIPRKEFELEKAKNALEKATAELETVKISVPADKNFATYMNNLYTAEVKVKNCSEAVQKIKDEIEVLNKEIVKLEEILTRFTI